MDTISSLLNSSEAEVFGVPKFLDFLRQYDPGFGKAYPCSDQDGVLSLIFWWIGQGHKDFVGIQVQPFSVELYPLLSSYIDEVEGIKLTRMFKGIYKARSDVQAAFFLNSKDGILDFAVWTMLYPEELYFGGIPSECLYGDDIEDLLFLSINSMPKFLTILSKHRDDLSKLSSVALLEWWNRYGVLEYPNLWFLSLKYSSRSCMKEVPEQSRTEDLKSVLYLKGMMGVSQNVSDEALVEMYLWWMILGHKSFPEEIEVNVPKRLHSALAKTNEIVGGLSVGKLLKGVYSLRPDLQDVFRLDSMGGVLEFACWVLLNLKEFRLSNTPLECLISQSIVDAFFQHEGQVYRLLHILQKIREDLAHLNDKELMSWWVDFASSEHPVLGALKMTTSHYNISSGNEVKKDNQAKGASLVGYAYGELGLGEDVRILAEALEVESVPFDVVVPKIQINTRAQDYRVKSRVVDAGHYSTSILCLPLPDIILAKGRGLAVSSSKIIGYAPWEFTTVPPYLRIVEDCVDEIWAISKFVYDCYMASFSIPVRYAPLAVSIDKYNVKRSRHRFGFSENEFIVLCNFDFNSSVERKNPLGCIRAFMSAFPGDRDVRLVVKTMNAHRYPEALRELVGSCAGDRRVLFVNETFERELTLNLMASVDCYLSLHRSEGFGRNIAEAMLLGVPTVVTGFGGNMDFCRQDNSFIVSYTNVPVSLGAGILGEWADPSIEDASNKLRQVFGDRMLVKRYCENAKHLISSEFCVARQGSRVAEYLNF